MSDGGAIRVPNIKTMGDAFADFGWGLVGGIVYRVSTMVLGNGLIGSLSAPLLAGSVIKGDRGTVIATAAGFMTMAGFGAAAPAAAAGASQDDVL
jgi:hypothetical protein